MADSDGTELREHEVGSLPLYPWGFRPDTVIRGPLTPEQFRALALVTVGPERLDAALKPDPLPCGSPACIDCGKGRPVARGLCRVCYDRRDWGEVPMPPKAYVPRKGPCPCGAPSWAKGLCRKCYDAKRVPKKPPKPRFCPCGGKHHAHGLCDRCYRKTLPPRKTPPRPYLNPRTP